MNLYVWIDENGKWRVAHRPPPVEGGDAVLLVALPASIGGGLVSVPTFIDMAAMEEVEVTV